MTKNIGITLILLIIMIGGYFFPFNNGGIRAGSTVIFVPQGGTGTSTIPKNFVLIGSTTGAITAVATSSLGIISSGGGVGTSTNPFMAAYFVATSTAATSTFSNGIKLTSGCFLMVNGSCAGSGGGGSTSPGGSDRQIQYNNSGSFGAEWGLSYTNLLEQQPKLVIGDESTTSILLVAANNANNFSEIFGRNVDQTSYFDLEAATSGDSGADFILSDDKGEVYFSPSNGNPFFQSTSFSSGNFILSSTTALFTGQVISTTTSPMSGALTLGTCDTVTSTIPGAAMSSTTVVNTTPKTWPGLSTFWYSYVTNSTTVVTKECGLGVVTPTVTAYNLDIFQ